MNYVIRPAGPSEYHLLEDFLYEAIFVPEGMDPPDRSILSAPELQIYIRDFGKYPDDRCLFAETDGHIAGAVWTRIMKDYGHLDDETPSFAIALYPEYRGRGIGTELMRRMIAMLKDAGYKKASLSVQKENFAVKMYLDTGFRIISENDEEYLMAVSLN